MLSCGAGVFVVIFLFQLANSMDRVYVYSPPFAVDFYPPKNINTGDYKSSFRENNGTGPIINAEYGMHDTFQFSLFDMVYNRLMTDARRTSNPEEATAFFIPYDIVIDSMLLPDRGVFRPGAGCRHALQFIDWLSDNYYFKRNYGHDHFVVYGGNQALFFFNRQSNCSKFLTYFCENCTKLSIDTYPNGYNSPNWVSVPFPSNFHWSSGMKRIPWDNPDGYRGVPISYTGGLSSFSRQAMKERHRMVAECAKHPNDCVHNAMSHASSQSNVNWYMMLNSTFCLNPIGDLDTRKGFFDSFLAGCIPVVTTNASARDVWKWHLGAEVVDATTIMIPKHMILRENHDFIATLLELYHDEEFVRKKRLAIAAVASRIQYRLPEASPLVTPPIDAVDIILENIFLICQNVSQHVAHPVDRGDNRHVEYFPFYPLGRNAINYHDPNYKYNSSFIVVRKEELRRYRARKY